MGLRPLRPLPADDLPCLERGRCAPGSNLPGPGRERLPAPGSFAGRGPAASGKFVQWRGNEYGLKRKLVGGRAPGTPKKATRAAAQHLRDPLRPCLATGISPSPPTLRPGQNVQKGVERTGYADFWELYKRNVLPRRNKNYVPIILASPDWPRDAAHYGIAVDPDWPVGFPMSRQAWPRHRHPPGGGNPLTSTWPRYAL